MKSSSPDETVSPDSIAGTSLVTQEASSALASTGGDRLLSTLVAPETSGTAMQRLRFDARAGSATPGSGVRATFLAGSNPKAAQDSAVLLACRRQIEALEEKLTQQISRVQQQSDRLREAAFQRVDAKMGSMEALQPKLDHRVSELKGNFKGLSDEMQQQIRRVDQMDSRLWDFRHQLEEDVRGKFVELEHSQQQVSSSVRMASATYEDWQKRIERRLLKVENLFTERQAYMEETSQNLMNLDARLAAMEDEGPRVCQDLDLAKDPFASAADAGVIMALETRCSDVSDKIEQFQKDSHEIHTKVEMQEEKLKILRTMLDSKEEHYRWLGERVERADWEGRFKEMQHSVNEGSKQCLEYSEKLHLVLKKFDSREEDHEQICDAIRRLQERALIGIADVEAPGEEARLAVGAGVPVEMEKCVARLDDSEKRLDTVTSELQKVQMDMELAPRVGALVEQLKQVAPKVMDQEFCVRELHEKVGRLEAGQVGRSTAGASDAIRARLSKLEVDVARIKSEVEGTVMEAVPGTEVVAAVDEESDASGEDDSDDEVDDLPEAPRRSVRRATATE